MFSVQSADEKLSEFPEGNCWVTPAALSAIFSLVALASLKWSVNCHQCSMCTVYDTVICLCTLCDVGE